VLEHFISPVIIFIVSVISLEIFFVAEILGNNNYIWMLIPKPL